MGRQIGFRPVIVANGVRQVYVASSCRPLTGLNDIISLEMTPDWRAPDVRPRLANCIGKARALRSAVAYWTVPADFVHPLLAARLAAPDGFLCTDVHLPTDVDQLADLVRRGASVRLFCEDIPTFREDGRKDLPYLVHTKILLFWMPDRTAELWIGSHNWTRRALVGLNVECSLIVRMADSSSLFSDAIQYLENVRRICEPFDHSKVDFYKQLQQKQAEGTVAAVEIEAADAASLKGLAVTVFGTDPEELSQVGALRNVHVSAFEESGSGEHIYEAVVMQSGLMSSYARAASGLSFAARRYAFRFGRRFPKLLQTSEVSSEVLRDALYFVVLDIRQYRGDLQAFDLPLRTDAWEPVKAVSSALLNRLNAEQISTVFRGKPPVVRAAAAETTDSMPLRAELEDRRALTQHRLIVRKLLRRKTY